MKRLHLDLETASEVDLKKVGIDVYANDPSTRILMCAYAFDDGLVNLWQPAFGPIPDDLASALVDPEITKVSWNVGFEFNVLSCVAHVPLKIEEWFDPMAFARYLGYPGGLGECGAAITETVNENATQNSLFPGVTDSTKDPIGKKLIKLFSMPTKATKKVSAHFKNWETHPTEWQQFTEYCRQDVRAERTILHRLEAQAKFPVIERRVWIIDQKVNQRGIPIDLEFVGKALATAEAARAVIIAQLKDLTGCENPNSVQQLGAWLHEQGYVYDSLNKSSVAEALATAKNLTPLGRQVLELKQLLGGIAFKKLPVIQKRTRNNRLCEAFTYHAAHTGRWASRGVQFHNLLKPTKRVGENNDAIIEAILKGLPMPADIHPIEAVGGTLRGAVCAGPGKRLFVADYSSIENRVLAWFACCPGMLDVFTAGLDPYKSFAAKMYGLPYDEVSKAQRNFCKSPVLGCGFGMGWRRLIAYAAQMGQKISEEEAQELVYAWRAAYPEVVAYWKEVGLASVRAVALKAKFQLGPLVFDGTDPNMFKIDLPSGRSLYYASPEVGNDLYMNKVLLYKGPGGKGGGWGQIEARGSALVENIVQATARDLLVNGMFNVIDAGFDLVLHVHDELVAEVDNLSPLTYAEFEHLMTKRPEWGLDIPVKAEGFEGTRYRK